MRRAPRQVIAMHGHCCAGPEVAVACCVTPRPRAARRQRRRLPEHIFQLRDEYVSVAGEVASVLVETDEDPRKVDHVWIQVRAGEFGRVQISLSTVSRQSRAAGFDPRVFVATITTQSPELPAAGVRRAAPFDYELLKSAEPLEFVPLERTAMEQLLVEKARRAVMVEGIGEFYVRAHIGVHQIHSRRSSFAVPRDVVGRDGLVRFYFRQPDVCEMLLVKFAGQP